MFKIKLKGLRSIYRDFVRFPDYEESPLRYRRLRRNMIILMLLVTVLPLISMGIINHYQYLNTLKKEIIHPMQVLVADKKRSFELFLAERLSAVSFVASAYSFEDLVDENTLNRIFRVMKTEFGGFVDLGLCTNEGLQVSYVGPYDLKGKQYADQEWFQELQVRDAHISDVFMGYRKFPHFVIAIKHISETHGAWILRATIDTEKFNNLVISSGLDAESDAFVVNQEGVLQTPSKFYGDVLEKLPMSIPPISFEPTVIERSDPKGKEILLAYAHFTSPHHILMVIKPRTDVLKAWYALKSELLLLLLGGVLVIFLVVYRLTGVLVKQIEASDQKRTQVFHEMEYTNKLASIGRLAAGVAHEVNNPMSIIGQKAGLMKDLIDLDPSLPQREKFLPIVNSIIQSVERCRVITHRLLGFARRMDVQILVIDINEIIKEVIAFLEKEAIHRNIKMELKLSENLPPIPSDQGQLQQVLLNILNNAYEAVDDGGQVSISSWDHDQDTIGISIQDNGSGMSQETLAHIFEPFYTTKKGWGTGLGLSITYGIVKKLGGSIEVQSQKGSGTTFTVYLPKKGVHGEEIKNGKLESTFG
ncbi:MAG: two-component sensor histidine kinase [Candidatus Latescibacteria bacterium]|nr:two-component sensor histidine kinase [Candidatus Latescibacterota bacterium]NIO55266.1 two-component sensor histidine kinase [Candidatus Latescibacterota bacterium]